MKKMALAIAVASILLLAIPWTGQAGHGHGRNRVFIGGSIWLGPPAYWGPPPWWGPRYHWHAPAYHGPPPAIVQRQPVYIERGQEEADYWYYCDNPQGFYPYIKSCPGGWMKVVPETVPPDR